MAEKVRGTKRQVRHIEPNAATHPRDEKTSLDSLVLECGHVLFLPSANSPRSAFTAGQNVYVMCGQCGPERERAEKAEAPAYTRGGKEDVI